MKNRLKKINIKEHMAKIKSDLVVDKLNAIEWTILGLLLLIITVTLFYGDNTGMFLTYFWLNEGFFTNFSIRFLGCNQLQYGIVQQWLCQLWVLPVNLVFRFVRFEPGNTGLIIWYKLSMTFVMTLCMSEMLKLAEVLKISKERAKWMLILFTSSILVALPVFHIAQTDILYAYFTLIGLRAYFEENNKKFMLLFAMAISCKGIAVVAFIPLVLLREKRILYIFRDSLIGVSIFLGERVWYKIVDKLDRLITGRTVQYTSMETVVKQIPTSATSNTTVVATVEKTLDDMSEGFFSHFYYKSLYFEFPAIRKGYMASVLVASFVLLCIWCYVQKKEESELMMRKALFAISVAWLIFFANASPSPYWIVAMYPTWFLLFFERPDRIKTNLLLHNVYTLSMFLVYVVNTDWVYGGSSNLDHLLLKWMLKPDHDSVNGPYVARYLNNMGIEKYMIIIVSVCWAAAVGLIAVNHYKSDVKDCISDNREERKIMHGFTLWQIAILAVWYMINVWVIQRW